MKRNYVSFTYRGSDQSAGRLLADLLSDITIKYTTKNGAGSADIGSMFREVLLGYGKESVPENPAGSAYQVQTEVPVIAVPRRMAYFLQNRNVPLDTPAAGPKYRELESAFIAEGRNENTAQKNGTRLFGNTTQRGKEPNEALDCD